MELSFPSGFAVSSPGSIPHTVFAYDPDGLRLIHVRVGSADSLLSADSLRAPTGTFQSVHGFVWTVPSGIPPGTQVRVIARVRDTMGLEAADSADFAIQSTPAGGR